MARDHFKSLMQIESGSHMMFEAFNLQLYKRNNEIIIIIKKRAPTMKCLESTLLNDEIRLFIPLIRCTWSLAHTQTDRQTHTGHYHTGQQSGQVAMPQQPHTLYTTTINQSSVCVLVHVIDKSGAHTPVTAKIKACYIPQPQPTWL